MQTKYEESLFYQINCSTKYFDKLFAQFLKELDIGISSVEHLALYVILQTKDCCQRDLARIMLKDRANTGKLALKLEKMGLIKIELKIKNNKPVKILTATPKGKKLSDKVSVKIEPLIAKIKAEMTEEKINNMIERLIEFRQIVKNNVKINI